METIGKYRVHEIASRLPRMSDDEFTELKESIRTQGLLHPVIVSDIDPLLIIDGRNRVRACVELGLVPRFLSLNAYLNESAERRELTWMTDDLTGLRKAEETGDYESAIEHFVIMQNVTRRHLSDFRKFKNILAFENGGNLPKHGGDKPSKKDKNFEVAKTATSKNRKEIAEAIGVSERKVDQMIAIEKDAPEEVKEALTNDEISVNKAYTETKQLTDMKKIKQKPKKKPDWFEENIEDENERFLWKIAVEITLKIEKKVGIIYLPEFRNLINKIDHINYKTYGKNRKINNA